jgi:phosphatidylglycerophosphatase C
MNTSKQDPRVAAFDFDGTLTRGDTLLPFLWRYLGTAKLLGVLLRCSPWLALYVLRVLPNHVAKARLLAHSFSGLPQTQAQAWADDFVRTTLPGLWRPWGLEKLREHQAQGDVCVLVSASPDLYLQAVAQHLGVALLCTQLVVVDGHYTGQMGANCHGPEKVHRLQSWLQAQGLVGAHLSAYGDTRGDLPMLQLADVAYYRERAWQPG